MPVNNDVDDKYDDDNTTFMDSRMMRAFPNACCVPWDLTQQLIIFEFDPHLPASLMNLFSVFRRDYDLKHGCKYKSLITLIGLRY